MLFIVPLWDDETTLSQIRDEIGNCVACSITTPITATSYPGQLYPFLIQVGTQLSFAMQKVTHMAYVVQAYSRGDDGASFSSVARLTIL